MTTVVRWNPFRELDMMERRMRPFFGAPPLPVADVYETPDELVFELEVPGFEQKELALEVTDHTLVVRGERAEAHDEKKSYLLQERFEQTFERRFHIPDIADPEKLTATFGHGVLEIHAPKVAEAEPRKITIGPSK